MYTKWTGFVWETTEIDSSAGPKSLALDSNDHPHISYFVENPLNYLKYATYNGSSWAIEILDQSTYAVGVANSLAIDSSNHPHIAYSVPINKTIKYARWTGSTWAKETVDTNTMSFGSISIALDNNSYPHLSYTTVNFACLHFARWTGSNWAKETISQDSSRNSSIALDSNGCAHISYNTYESGAALHYAYACDKFSWNLFLPAITNGRKM